MILHNDKDLFDKAIKETADNLTIREVFIEKDYWISLVLKKLSESKYVDKVVFKGGTSLSKGFDLIKRFSEDVDMAVIDTAELTGNQIKTILRSVEKLITADLQEIEKEGITSKGSRYRKSVYQYPTLKKAEDNTLIVEINSFANPYPYEKRTIQSMIGQYLQEKNETKLVEDNNLQTFELNILDKKQTMIEKLVSLFRFSFDNQPVAAMSEKIRHFYDLYFLAEDKECNDFIHSESFVDDFNKLLEHDKQAFNEPGNWNKKEIHKSPLLTDFNAVWDKLKQRYKDELSDYAFIEIPSESDVANNFKKLTNIIIG